MVVVVDYFSSMNKHRKYYSVYIIDAKTHSDNYMRMHHELVSFHANILYYENYEILTYF